MGVLTDFVPGQVHGSLAKSNRGVKFLECPMLIERAHQCPNVFVHCGMANGDHGFSGTVLTSPPLDPQGSRLFNRPRTRPRNRNRCHALSSAMQAYGFMKIMHCGTGNTPILLYG